MNERGIPLPRVQDLRVLAVEDHAVGRRLVETMLDSFGADHVVVESAEEAEDAACAARFDVVLIDLGLPDRDGMDLAARLASAPGTCAAAMIAVTGRARPAHLPAAFADWLEKPYSARDLHRALLNRSATAGRRYA